MAPTKGNKRPTSAAVTSPKKKSRVDPAFARIVATLHEADNVNESTREMLVAMASPCLSAPKCERHSVQQLGVTMIDEMLLAHKAKLIDTVEVARKELAELDGSKSALLQRVEDVKASLAAKQVEKTAAHSAHEEAKTATKAAKNAVKEATETQTTGDAAYTALEAEKVAIDTAYQEHFKVPMDANECPHHSYLKPFIETLGLEESLISALPSSCVKTVEQRGGFDTLVLTELGKALVGKIACLEKRIVDDAAGVSERKVNVVSAEAVLETKEVAEKAAAADLEAATAAQSEAEAEVVKANEEWTTFEPRVQEATSNFHVHDTIRIDFEEGALKDFAGLRDKEAPKPVEEEAAVAGA